MSGQPENTDPVNTSFVQSNGAQPVAPQPGAPQQQFANAPALVGEDIEIQLAPQHIRISNVIVPEVGDEVYVFNEPGSRDFVFRGLVVEYPMKVNGRPRFEFVSVRILEYLQPDPVPGSLRQRLNTLQMVRRKFIRYYRKATAAEYRARPMPEENYQAYLDSLYAEDQDPVVGGKTRRKRKSSQHKKRHGKRKQSKKSQKSKKSYKRRI